MHEHSFVDAVVRDIEDKEKVARIVLEVGELAGIEAEHLKEHVEERFGWGVRTLTKDAVVKCDCGFDGRPRILERLHDFVVFECPGCGEIPEIVEGKDIKIVKVVYR
jgi:Zn finger protein HypA/HybF involved in hydrogenase expression